LWKFGTCRAIDSRDIAKTVSMLQSADLASGQIAVNCVEKGRDDLARLLLINKRHILHPIGENLAQIGQLVQEI